MYERLLNKEEPYDYAALCAHCQSMSNIFDEINEHLISMHKTTKTITFPYGSGYGWCCAHHKGKKLICNIFAEIDACTIMIRLSNKEFNAIYSQVSPYTQHYIDHKYPCGEGGWIHYRISQQEHVSDILTLLDVKCK